MSARIQQIKDLVGNDEVEDAIDLLMGVADELGAKREHQSELLLSARFKEYEQNKLNNTLSEKLLGTEIAAILQRVQKVDNNVYEVAVYAYNCPPDLLPKAAAYFSRNGYHLTDTATLQSSQSWLARQPAVIYYGAGNQKKAAALAADLKQATGLRFLAQEGAGYGVPKEVRAYTFKVHLVR
ncbi:MAG: hypothetical protein IPJ82_21035 [Lewinellaceae bacterium]|nr:hypothetical protein [Lewinellaceae bacterium]